MHDEPGMKVYRPSMLTFSAHKRCRCGAGLAFPKTCKDPYYFWGCGYLLTTDIKYRPIDEPANPFDAGTLEDEENVKHDCAFSFVWHEIQKEVLDGPEIITTRDQEEVVIKKKPRKKS